VKANLKRNIISGAVVITPVAVSAYVVFWVYEKIATLPGTGFLSVTNSPAVNELVRVGVSLVVIAVGLAVIGYLVRTAFGGFLKQEVDEVASKIPVVRIVYNATKMGVETLMSNNTDEFERPVKIEVAGLRVTAFKTGNTTEDGREVVFVPTSPNITPGYVVDVRPENLQETDEDVEEALTRVLSAGFGAGETDIEDIIGGTTGDVDNEGRGWSES